MCSYLIADDIYDKADIRRGKICWHKIEGMEKIVANNMLLLEIGCQFIMNRFFGHLPCYTGMIQILTECYMTSLTGHLYEMQINEIGLDHFTFENYNYSAVLKTSSYRFYLPAAMATLLAG